MHVGCRLSKPCSSALSHHCPSSRLTLSTQHPTPNTQHLGVFSGCLEPAQLACIHVAGSKHQEQPSTTAEDSSLCPLGRIILHWFPEFPSRVKLHFPNSLLTDFPSLSVTFSHSCRCFLGSPPKSTAYPQILLLGSASGETQTQAVCSPPKSVTPFTNSVSPSCFSVNMC